MKGKVIGFTMARARRRKGLEQQDVADVLGCHKQFVSNIERGLCSLPPKHFRKVSKTLELPLPLLVGSHMIDVREDLWRRIGR